jgi:drug/metabolite transporter (DMT)-like permease
LLLLTIRSDWFGAFDSVVAILYCCFTERWQYTMSDSNLKRYEEGERQRLLDKPPQNNKPRGKLEIEKPIRRNDQSHTSLTSNDSDESASNTNSQLLTAFIFMLFFQLANRLYGKLQTYPMRNYPLFCNLQSCFVYIPICYMYILPTLMYTNNISKEQQDIPKYKFAVMGGYDSLSGIMQTFAINYITNASLIVLVQQSAIPISMAISVYALNSVYTKSQYLGAAVVLMGIVVVLIPTFFGGGLEESSSSSPGAVVTPSTEMFWLIVMIISCVPMCLSSVYKEKALGETEIDVVYLNGWVAIFQFLIAIPLSFPTAWVQGLPMSEIWSNMVGGFWCYCGYNSIVDINNPMGLPLDECAKAPYYVTAYLIVNVVYNLLMVLVLKLGSANILWMASTIIVPVGNVVFSFDFMPGHQPLKFWDLVGLVVIMIGLVIYRFSNEVIFVWKKLTGQKLEEEDDEKTKQIVKKAERKQWKYLGLNQAEYMQTFVDTRVSKEKANASMLVRSPTNIRGAFLAKIGIPPSPLISMGPGKRPLIADQEALNAARANYQATGYSPMMRNNTFREGTPQLGKGSGGGGNGTPSQSKLPRPYPQ